jgi:tRNA A37 methylthiotransferase MiaB
MQRVFTTFRAFATPTKVLSRHQSTTTVAIKQPTLIPTDGKTLGDFLRPTEPTEPTADLNPIAHYLDATHPNAQEQPRTFSIETYGCQMNVSDSEVVRAVLLGAGYEEKPKATDEAVDVILLNTCAIRDKAETRIWNRLKTLRQQTNKQTKLGVLGCMAERLKEKLLEGHHERAADFVVGPDGYRDLPHLLRHVMQDSSRAKNQPQWPTTPAEEEAAELYDPSLNMSVQLTVDETYADIAPVRDNHSSVSAFTTIMRGCNNMCSFCIVPHVRGRERSRSATTIVDEVQRLSDSGYKEVVLLGQNVNSYFNGDVMSRKKKSNIQNQTNETTSHGQGNSNSNSNSNSNIAYVPAAGFDNMYRLRDGRGVRFADLLASVAEINPEMRVRFTSPHPKDFPDSVLDCISSYPNISRGIHMPAQSGSNNMLHAMRRNHTRQAYLDLIHRFREKIPGVEFSTDLITGFCGETEKDHEDTLSLLKEVEYEMAFMFAYSMRERTHAWHNVEKGRWADDVSDPIKKRRLSEIVSTYRETALARSQRVDLNQMKLVLVEGNSRRSTTEQPQLTGRTDTHKRCVFETECWSTVEDWRGGGGGGGGGGDDALLKLTKNKTVLEPGDYVAVHVDEAAVSTLISTPLFKTTLAEFNAMKI